MVDRKLQLVSMFSAWSKESIEDQCHDNRQKII